MWDYIHDGKEIYKNSFAIIRKEAKLATVSQDMEKVAVRLIHASGMTDVIRDLAYSPGAATLGRAVLAAGSTIFCDSQMVAYGITKARLPSANKIVCTLADERTAGLAIKLGNTRSAAALELWGRAVENAIVAIGNAPTALFHLLELIEQGLPKPALILGFPVGFVGAAESKLALADNPFGIPFITLHGRRGGSAMAAAAVNALASEQE